MATAKIEWDEVTRLVNNAPVRKQTSRKQLQILYEYKKKLPLPSITAVDLPVVPISTVVNALQTLPTETTSLLPDTSIVQIETIVEIVPPKNIQPASATIVPSEKSQPASATTQPASATATPKSCMKKRKTVEIALEDLRPLSTRRSILPLKTPLPMVSADAMESEQFEIEYCPCELERDQYKQVRFSQSYSYSYSSSTKHQPVPEQQDETVTIEELPSSIACKYHLYKCNGMPADREPYRLRLPSNTDKPEQQNSPNVIQISTQLSSYCNLNQLDAIGTFMGIIPILQDIGRDNNNNNNRTNSTNDIKKVSTVGLRQCKFELEWVYEVADTVLTLTPVIMYRLPFWGTTCLNPPNHIEIPRLILTVQVYRV